MAEGHFSRKTRWRVTQKKKQGRFSWTAPHRSGPALKQLPVTLELPGAGVLGGISVMLLVKVLRVSALLLLLLHLHPAGGHGRREPGSQGLEAGQLY